VVLLYDDLGSANSVSFAESNVMKMIQSARQLNSSAACTCCFLRVLVSCRYIVSPREALDICAIVGL
jgi:hypothetical protein